MSFTENPMVDALLSRSYGQGGTVALPNMSTISTSDFPTGRFPAGVQDVLNRLGDHYASWTPSSSNETPLEWCFLVGGPGNGKSQALKLLAELLGVSLPPKQPGQPAPRAIPVEWPPAGAPVVEGLEIVFINDSSIPRQGIVGSGQFGGSLYQDLSDALGRLVTHGMPLVLFGNVNRGILVEEQDALQTPLTSSPSTAVGLLAAQVIRWLANSSEPSADTQNQSPGEAAPLGSITLVELGPSYYAQARLHLTQLGADHDVILHAVFLDALSLLEPTPGTGGCSIDLSTTPPVVAPYQPLGGFNHGSVSREHTVAGDLLSAVVTESRWDDGGCINPADGTLCEAHSLCPLAQNARWLRNEAMKRHFLDALRASEIAAGRRLTYRDLVGHLSLAILGQPEADWLRNTHPCRWVASKVTELTNQGRGVAVDLVSHRVYTNLFPIPDPTAWKRSMAMPRRVDSVYSRVFERSARAGEASRVRAFEQAFNSIDSARDIEAWEGIRADVLDAIEALDIEYPSDRMQAAIPPEANTELERHVDQLIRAEITHELGSREGAAATRASVMRTQLLRKWRSMLLLRQVGLALGWIASRAAVEAWLAEQANALLGGASRSPLALGDGVRALILPQMNSTEYWLAPLRPRIYNLTGDPPANTVLVSLPIRSLYVEIVARGDNLMAEVLAYSSPRRPPETVATLVIDLPIAREAILHAGGDLPSFTEIGESAFARIERARASLVGRVRMKEAAVYFTDDLKRRYRIIPNPASLAQPLRVEPVVGGS